MSHLQRNLDLAERAVKYVESVMTHGASNKPIDVKHSEMKLDISTWGPNWVPPSLTAEKPDFKLVAAGKPGDSAQAQRTTLKDQGIDSAVGIATHVEGTGIGNCGEQARVAFKYLGVRAKPGDTIVLASMGKNHDVVILGVPRDTIRGSYSPGNRPLGWGGAAVICDPWYHEWFAVQLDWTRKVESILRETEPGNSYGFFSRFEMQPKGTIAL